MHGSTTFLIECHPIPYLDCIQMPALHSSRVLLAVAQHNAQDRSDNTHCDADIQCLPQCHSGQNTSACYHIWTSALPNSPFQPADALVLALTHLCPARPAYRPQHLCASRPPRLQTSTSSHTALVQPASQPASQPVGRSASTVPATGTYTLLEYLFMFVHVYRRPAQRSRVHYILLKQCCHPLRTTQPGQTQCELIQCFLVLRWVTRCRPFVPIWTVAVQRRRLPIRTGQLCTTKRSQKSRPSASQPQVQKLRFTHHPQRRAHTAAR